MQSSSVYFILQKCISFACLVSVYKLWVMLRKLCIDYQWRTLPGFCISIILHLARLNGDVLSAGLSVCGDVTQINYSSSRLSMDIHLSLSHTYIQECAAQRRGDQLIYWHSAVTHYYFSTNYSLLPWVVDVEGASSNVTCVNQFGWKRQPFTSHFPHPVHWWMIRIILNLLYWKIDWKPLMCHTYIHDAKISQAHWHIRNRWWKGLF